MADKKNDAPPADKPPPKEVPPDKKPIENETVHVTVTPKTPPKTPQERRDWEKFRDGKLKPAIKGDVKEALEKGKPGGSKEQLKEVKKTLADVEKKVDPNKVKEIEVKVEGDVGGKPMPPDVTKVKPDEGKSAGAASPDPKKP